MQRLGPAGQVGQDLGTADDRLDRKEDGRDQRQPEDRPVRSLCPPRGEGHSRHDQADNDRNPAVKHVRRIAISQRRQK